MKTINTLLFVLLFSFSMLSQGNGYLGISMKKAQVEGVRISDILENGAAQAYGLKQNDVILSINGVVVNTALELKNQIGSKNWGESISIVYKRNGHSQSQKIALGNRANKVTYHVKRKVTGNTIVWNFDDKTYVTMVSGTPTEVTKLGEDNVLYIQDLSAEAIVPARFSDLDDKLEIIEAINIRNAGKRFFPSVTVYIKTYTKAEKVKATKTSASSELNVFPNPSLGEFQFNLTIKNPESKLVTWQIFDISGKKITEGTQNDFNGLFNQNVDLTVQGAGVYLLKIVNAKEVLTERIIVN